MTISPDDLDEYGNWDEPTICPQCDSDLDNIGDCPCCSWPVYIVEEDESCT